VPLKTIKLDGSKANKARRDLSLVKDTTVYSVQEPWGKEIAVIVKSEGEWSTHLSRRRNHASTIARHARTKGAAVKLAKDLST
jgi:hypothetical protein